MKKNIQNKQSLNFVFFCFEGINKPLNEYIDRKGQKASKHHLFDKNLSCFYCKLFMFMFLFVESIEFEQKQQNLFTFEF